MYENAVSGLHFRKKTEANGAHRNIIRDNIIENNQFDQNGNGLFLVYSTGTQVIDNIITNSAWAIVFNSAPNNVFYNNTMVNGGFYVEIL